MNPRLAAISGPLKGRAFPLGDTGLSAGRAEGSSIFMDDDQVSRRHCAFRMEKERALVRDLDSTNGTIVNDSPITGDVQLQHGDEVKIGNSKFTYFEFDDETAPLFTDAAHDTTTAHILSLKPEEIDYLNQESVVQPLPSTSRTERDLGVLLRINSSINEIKKTDTLQDRLLELILEAIPAQRVAILLTDDSKADFTSEACWERGIGIRSPFRVSRAITHQVLRDGVSLLSNNIVTDHVIDLTESILAAQIHSILCVPLRVFNKTIGVIYADSTETIGGFDRDCLQLLTAIAGIGAVALEHVRHVEWLEGENERLHEEIRTEHGMIGESPAIEKVFHLINQVSPSDSTVLILGESGAGKELVAEAVHRNSKRSKAPYQVVDCASIPDNLIESELFGHEKGAFTGATARRIGKIQAADGGTVFLDEIGELPYPMQSKLLRLLQEHKITRVGSNDSIKVNVRIIAATNRNLEKEVEAGQFRKDLYYRLNVVPIRVPTLLERSEDIPLLAYHFIKRWSQESGRLISGFTPEALLFLKSHNWPGNVRELDNVIQRCVVMGSSEHISLKDLKEFWIEKQAGSAHANDYHSLVLEAEREILRRAFREAGRNKTRAADQLALNPTYFFRLVKRHGLKDEFGEKDS